MKKIIACITALHCIVAATAQPLFIEKATIEFEVKSNIKKSMGSGMWGEMMADKLPTFKVAYFNFTFANNKSIYKLDRFDEKIKIPDWMKNDDEGNEWYADHNTGLMLAKKNVVGASFYIKDSLLPIEWKLVNENMTIAGFNCRKAVGKIFDSVYVFAFYTEEIPISGGPCSITGLPGMVLGMTIPRMYTSWIATKVMVNGVNETVIKPADAKKTTPRVEFRKQMLERTKDWGGDEEGNQWKERFLWTAQL
ncbi:MAG TPA: GLPGLI family protein [Ferruginibacter sp.]|nr:GLPGLI family protein [Ferruginibacter sp.]HMP21627.1 GLPGLI family protein [Ferruginibacter sp.]